MNIFISNLSAGVDSDALKKLFEPFGEVTSAKVIVDRATERSKGYGFVEMEDVQGQTAIAALHGADQEGKPLSVSVSVPKPDTYLVSTHRSGSHGGSRRGY